MDAADTRKPRRGHGEGGVYQRASDGRWVAALYVGRVDGRRVKKVKYAATRAAAVRKLQAMQKDYAASALVATSPTVEAWLLYWLDEIAAARLRPSTHRTYKTYVTQHVIPRIGHHRLDRLEPSHVRGLYSAMRKACPKPTEAGRCPHTPSHGLAEASIRQTHAILSRALKVAVREGKASRNVCELVDPPSTKRHPRKPLTVAEARSVLATCADEDLESRWYAALWLGLRQGEALGLRWTHVNLEEGWLFVEVALQRQTGKGLVIVDPKSDTSVRRVPIPPMVLSRLKVHWARHVAANGPEVDASVWTRNGKPIDPSWDAKEWRRLLKRAGVGHVALHAARNTTGSLLMAAGVGDKIIQEILGHSVVQITQQHYLEGSLEQHRSAMLALEAYASEDDR